MKRETENIVLLLVGISVALIVVGGVYTRYVKPGLLVWLAASAVVLIGLAAIVSGRYAMFWLLPVVGYGCAWIGHFVIEKNRPATFTYPRWSLLADYKMLGMALTGRLVSELELAVLQATAPNQGASHA